MDNGWAINVLGSYTHGDGYAQGTNFKVFNYFANISKLFNANHQLSFTIFGAPQEHYSRSNALTKADWEWYVPNIVRIRIGGDLTPTMV